MIPYVRFLRANSEIFNGSIFKHYFLRKRRDDVLTDAPKLIITKMVYDFETPQERLMYDYVAERIDETQGWLDRHRGMLPWRVRGQMALTLILRQRQAAIHPQLVLNAEKVWARQMGDVYDHEWNPRMVTKINKIAELVAADQRAGQNTLIITHFAEEMKMIQNRLVEDGVKIRMLNGKTTPKKRAELEKKEMFGRAEMEAAKSVLPLPDDVVGNIMSFLDNTPEVVILQIQAGGVGISLPWVHHVVNAAPDWNPFLEQQSIYRAYRVNTKHDVRVTAMYFRDTIEVDMQKRQADKMMAGAEWVGDPFDSVSEYIRMPIM
jgi:SNF2 family DNA or RNA helicase